MKKFLILFSLILTFSLSGCSSETKTKDIPVSEIKDTIISQKLIDVNPLNDIPAQDAPALSSVKDKIKEGFMLGTMINVKLRDVIVVKTDDSETVMEALNDYKENSLKMFADGYGGEDNIESMSNSILKSVGNYVYFIATPNASDIETTILNLIQD
jgi:hypothetical protein